MAVFTLTSSGTLGDHFPFLALGRALVGRGHQVRYAGPLYLRPQIEECGLEFRRARPELDPGHVKNRPAGFDHWSENRGGRPALKKEPDAPELYENLEFEDRLTDLLAASEGADMLLCSSLQPVGRMVSELAGIPWITICVVPWFYPLEGSSAAKGIAAREAATQVAPVSRRFHERIDQLRRRLGLEPIPAGSESKLFEAPRVLLATSPLFGRPAERTDCEIFQTGFWLHDPPGWSGWEPPAEVVQLLAQKPEPLVLSFSSQPLREPEAILDMHLAAARSLGKVLVAQSGWAELGSALFRAACLREEAVLLPEGPQGWIFSQAGAVINHGGIGTVARALRAGAPLLVEPFGNDQFYNARQVVALGAGAAVNPHRLTATGLAQVLRDKVLTQETRSRVGSLAPELDSTKALERACLQVERWLEE